MISSLRVISLDRNKITSLAFKNLKFSWKRTRRPPAGGYTTHNRVRLVEGGTHFFELLTKLISEAKHSIHLQTYAYADDETGTNVANALREAAQRGVKIYLLVDGFASRSLSSDFIKQLKASGIQFRFFEPFLRSKYFYFGRRLHHKVTVFDGVHALVGSMNIANRYNDIAEEKSWLDMALYVEGEAAMNLEAICWKFWLKKKHNLLPEQAAVDYTKAIPLEENVPVRIRQNDWVMRKVEISQSYNALFTNAQDHIYIMCSYFLPTKKLLRQLKRTSARGVKIEVVLAGTSDVKTSKFAERYLYRWMIRNKMTIYEYQPTVLHGKLSIADSEQITLGSYNINGLSAYASVELNLDVKDKKLGIQMEKRIKQIIAEDCKQVDPNNYVRHLFTPRQLLYWCSYQFMSLMLTFTTFYFKQRD